jgi:hypothetical protein
LICFGFDSTLFEMARVGAMPDHNSDGAIYAFLDKVFNRFPILVEIFNNPSIKFHEDF